MVRDAAGDAGFGAGARWHRAHEWFAVGGCIAFIAALGLAVWMDSLANVRDPINNSRGAALETLMVGIPRVAVAAGTSDLAVAVARIYVALVALALVAAAAAGGAWLRADRLRKPLTRDVAPRHRAVR